MNEDLGKIITAFITDINENKYYAQKSGTTYEIAERDIDKAMGDKVEGFAYENRFGNNKLATDIPDVSLDRYGFATVVEVKREYGVFVDIGLPDKDLLVSLDELPSEHSLWPKSGDQLLVRLEVDEEGQMWGVLAEDERFEERGQKAPRQAHNADIEAVVYNPKIVGTYILTTDSYLGFIHPSEREREPRLGEVVKGRIIDVKEDGTVNVSLYPRAHEMIESDARTIYEVLKRSPDQKMTYTNKSNPDDIRDFFGMSKGQFKRAIGRLMKYDLVKQDEEYTYLLKRWDEYEDEKDAAEND